MSPVLFLALFSELRLLGPSSVTSGFLWFITLEASFRKPFLFDNLSINMFAFKILANL